MLVIEHRVAPTLIVGIVEIYIGVKVNNPGILLIPSVFSPHVDVVLPHLGLLAKVSLLLVGVVVQAGCLYKEAVSEHLHVILKAADAGLGVISPAVAFDNLTLIGTHSPSKGEFSRTVFGVIVKITGAQCILVLVVNLNHFAAETGKVIVGIINNIVALDHGLVLYQLDVVVGLDLIHTHVPDSRIAEHICPVVKESGRTANLTILPLARALENTCILRTQQSKQAVLVLIPFFALGRSLRAVHQHKNQSQEYKYIFTRSNSHSQTCNR